MKSKKKFNSNKVLYISLSLLSLSFITGLYFVITKFINKPEKVKNNQIKIVKKVDESLTKNEWIWVETITSNSQKVKPRVNDFVLKINSDSSFSSSTDCNSVSGSLSVNNEKINFTKIVATEKFCPKSLESNFTAFLKDVVSYRFNEKKQLILILKDDSGLMFFNEKVK